MSYVSFAILIGVKCLRIISHRPETYNLVQKATINETIFESALKLALVMQIFLSSGYGISASVLSASFVRLSVLLLVWGRSTFTCSLRGTRRNFPKPQS